MKRDLARTPRYDLQHLFDAIEKDGSKMIDRASLKSFLLSMSFIPNDNLVMAIIRRMDLDSDAKLTFLEFVEAVRPMQDQPKLPDSALKERPRSSNYSMNRNLRQSSSFV